MVSEGQFFPPRHPQNVRLRGKRGWLGLGQIKEAAQAFDLELLTIRSIATAMNVDRKALNYQVKDRYSALLAEKAGSTQIAAGAASVTIHLAAPMGVCSDARPGRGGTGGAHIAQKFGVEIVDRLRRVETGNARSDWR